MSIDAVDSSSISAGGSGAQSPPLGAASTAPAQPVANPLDLAVSVTRQVQISSPSNWKHLVSGIDTLDLGFYVDWGEKWPVLEKALIEGKQSAEKTQGILWQHHPEQLCLILPSGKPPMYAFHLQLPDFHLFIARSPKWDKYPNVYVSILAKSLWLRGPIAASEQVAAFIRALGGAIERTQVSRVDLSTDHLITGGLSLDFVRRLYVSRSSENRQYLNGDNLETFYVGSGKAAVQARIYHKSVEIFKEGLKAWFFDEVWKIPYCHDVWRIEFQLRREILKQFSIESLESLREKAAGVWAYLTDSWLSLRLQDNENVSRRTVHPLWVAVQESGRDFGTCVDVKRKYSKGGQAPAEWYTAHAGGCLAGFAARVELDDFDSALALFVSEIREYWRDRDFASRYLSDRIKLGFDDSKGGQP